MPNSGHNRQFFVPYDLEIWQMTLKNNTASLLCWFKLCASFHSHQWIQTWFRVRKPFIWVKIDGFASNIAPLMCIIATFRVPFHRHMWIETGVTVRKLLNMVLTSVIFTFGLWTFCMDLTYVIGSNLWKFLDDTNIVKKGFTDRQTDGQTDKQTDGWNHS